MRGAIAAVLWAILAAPGRAENWPQWRGPFFNGSTTETNLPQSWGENENVAWVTPLSGPSGSTPIVWGGRIFLSSLDVRTKGLLAVCIDAQTGRILWQKPTGRERAFSRNNMASPSPVTDGKGVYFLYGTGELAAFNYEGRPLWSKDLEKEHGKFAVLFGYSSSPLLYAGKLYVLVMHRDVPIREEEADPRDPKKSYLLAIDPQTGKDLWKHVRPTDAKIESHESYSTPMPYDFGWQSQIIIFGADYLTGHDSRTGRELWRWATYNPDQVNHWRTVSSPVVTRDMIYVSGPKKEPLFAIRTGGEGNVGADYVAWKFVEFTTDAATSLYYKGRLYVLDGDKRVMTCLDGRTGRRIWQGDMGGSEVFRGSPTGADNKIYCMNERGEVVVLAADEYKVLFRISMGGPVARSTIVAANGRLLIRTAKALHCIRFTKPIQADR